MYANQMHPVCAHTRTSGSPSNEDVNLLTLFSHITGLLCAHSLKSKLVTVLPGDSVSMVTHKEPFPPGMQEEGRGRREGPRSGEEKEIRGGNPPYPTGSYLSDFR